MEILTNPQHYNVCFNIASLFLLMVVFIINISEDLHNNKQKRIFGMIISCAVIMNICGFIHYVWVYSDVLDRSVPYTTICALVIFEKGSTYLLSYLSMLYVMTIFGVEADTVLKKAILAVPAFYAVIVFLSGFISDFYFIFSDTADIEFNYPQGATVNICLYLYFLYAGYLYIKYASSFSTEKFLSLILYYIIMLAGIPIRILTRSGSIFEFTLSIALLLCVYTFQNPAEFRDSVSGAGTKNALNFAISNNLIQKKVFTIFGVSIERLDVLLGGESTESASELLMQITSYLKQLTPDGGIFYSEDGVYMLLFPESESDDPIIEKISEQIKKRFKEPWILNDKEIKLFQSQFVVGFPDEADSLEKFNEIRGIIKKTQFRSRGVIKVSDLNLKHVEHDKKIDSIVKRALDDGLLEVYYQPIYNTKIKKYTSCEALLRLKDPHLGFISPAVFMPIAERNGMVIAIDSFVLSSVCEMLAKSDAVSLGLEYAEVNLSVVDCIQTDLADKVIKTMSKFDIKPEQINLEITETFDEGITSIMDENIRTMREHGITFSMDDFGTGYSNLSRIATLPVEIFKLDKSIIQSAFEEETSYMVMFNIVKIIKSLDRKIVAEGVETKEQASQIIRLGCDYIQGFYYARPMPKDQFIEFLRENNT